MFRFDPVATARGSDTDGDVRMKTKRTEIMIEVEEVIQAVNHSHRLTRAWCRECGSEAQMITPEQAATISQVSVRAVNQRVEAGSVHFLETPDGRLLVCVNSLSEPPAEPDWSASVPLAIALEVSPKSASEDPCAPLVKNDFGGLKVK